MSAPTVRIEDQGVALVVAVDYGHGAGFEFAASYPTRRGAAWPAAREQGLAEAWAKAEGRKAEILAPYGGTP